MWFHQLLLSALFWVVLKEGKVYLHKIKVVYYVSTLVRIHNTLQKGWSKCDNSNVICNLPLTYVVSLTITDTFSHCHFSARGNEKLKGFLMGFTPSKLHKNGFAYALLILSDVFLPDNNQSWKERLLFNREPNIQCDSSCWVKTHFELQDICRRNFYNYLVINY